MEMYQSINSFSMFTSHVATDVCFVRVAAVSLPYILHIYVYRYIHYIYIYIYIFICDVWSFDIAGDTIIVFLNVLTMQICEVFFIYTVLYRVLVTQTMDNRCRFVCGIVICLAAWQGTLECCYMPAESGHVTAMFR